MKPALKPKSPVAPPALRLFAMLFALVLAGCSTVTIISDYDEGTDKGVSEFQKSVNTFLTGLEQAGRPAGALTQPEIAFFQKAQVDLEALQLRASVIPKNGKTQDMLHILGGSMDTLKELVPLGVTKEQVKPIRDALDASTGAILKFELAKKRGDKETAAK